jgi:hypothetical protein
MCEINDTDAENKLTQIFAWETSRWEIAVST